MTAADRSQAHRAIADLYDGFADVETATNAMYTALPEKVRTNLSPQLKALALELKRAVRVAIADLDPGPIDDEADGWHYDPAVTASVPASFKSAATTMEAPPSMLPPLNQPLNQGLDWPAYVPPDSEVKTGRGGQ